MALTNSTGLGAAQASKADDAVLIQIKLQSVFNSDTSTLEISIESTFCSLVLYGLTGACRELRLSVVFAGQKNIN